MAAVQRSPEQNNIKQLHFSVVGLATIIEQLCELGNQSLSPYFFLPGTRAASLCASPSGFDTMVMESWSFFVKQIATAICLVSAA
jgi:hypothetical protein